MTITPEQIKSLLDLVATYVVPFVAPVWPQLGAIVAAAKAFVGAGGPIITLAFLLINDWLQYFSLIKQSLGLASSASGTANPFTAVA